MKIYYLNQINTFAYSAQAINFINTPKVISDIKEHAEKINVSTTAVAGIMAEENDSYWKKSFLNGKQWGRTRLKINFHQFYRKIQVKNKKT